MSSHRRASVLSALLLSGSPVLACGAARSPVSGAESASDAATPEAIARQYLALSPGWARAVGLHEYDGKIADVSAAGITRRIETVRELEQVALRAAERSTEPDEQLDWRILAQVLSQDLFDLMELESWRTRPMFYGELFSVDEYIVRDYAPKEQRIIALRDHLRASKRQLPSLQNLRSPLSEPVLRTAVDIFKGYATYLRGDVSSFLEGSSDASVRSEGKALALELASAAEAFATRLEREELPRADQSHVLGRARFERLLQVQEALSTPLEELLQKAEADQKRNQAAYEALATTVKKTRPKASELLHEAQRLVDDSRAFISAHQIVGLPSEPNVEVKETPPFMRWNQAFLNGGGPFDRADLRAYYYITPPDPSWPPQEQEQYILSRGELAATSVHEVFPGHYLQALWQRNAPTFVQKVTGSYSFAEGWAHYVEQMMVDEGFASELAEARLGQLADALLRNCRFIASIGIHTLGMSVDEAKRRFMEDCKQDEASARQQAIRGTFDPGYFAYTLGKLQILELREEAKQRLGERFNLQRFHDTLLSHGAPPLSLIRERVLAELSAP
jgi:uncharacterized protein (DUF885 family)